jgi:hypothetical protein
VLSIVDVVVSKLKRMNPNDAVDIENMVERDLVPHSVLIERFRAAVDYCADAALGEDIPQCVRHLHRVERDLFGVDETEIELPSWLT